MISFDFKNPDYKPVILARIERLKWLREEPQRVAQVKAYYADGHIADFIDDWGWTYDPRSAGKKDRMPYVPFILVPKQRDWVDWFYESWKTEEEGVTEKSRDMGVSWLAISASCALCSLYDGMTIGFGSRKKEYVDQAGVPRALFYKARDFMERLPEEFQAGWSRKTDADMRITFPHTRSVMSGESGDSIGRGDRTGIYVTDEDAHLEHPETVDAALSATTNCRIRVSSANGTANPFYLKRQQYLGTRQLFTFHWRDNPMKDAAWYAKKVAEINNPVIVAQELDINYSASIEGVVIPNEWVQASIDAHIFLGFGYDGMRFGSLDISDQGKDKNAFCGVHGVIVEFLDMWSGKNSDIFETTAKAFKHCDDLKYRKLRYDSVGVGAGVRGDARKLNEDRKGLHSITVEGFNGGGELFRPDDIVPGTDRRNVDYFANPKAQGWWDLRGRFQRTYMAVNAKRENVSMEFDSDELISLSGGIAYLQQASTELSQVAYKLNGAGKLLINKAPDEAPSPNLADSIMQRFARMKSSMVISDDVIKMMRRRA